MPLFTYTIYDHPRDYPNHWVVRRFRIASGCFIPEQECQIADSLEQARRLIPSGLTRFERSPDDSPEVVETWM